MTRIATGFGPARRRFLAVTLAIVGVAGLGIASAAQLSLTTAPLGAGTEIVATCQGEATITVDFSTAWATSPAPQGYRVTDVRLTGVAASCAGKTFSMRLLDAAGAAVGPELTGTLASGTTTVPISSAGRPLAQTVAGVALVVHG